MNRSQGLARQGVRMIRAAMLAPLLAGCAPAVQQTVLPDRIEYACANGRALAVSRSPDGRHATIPVEGRELTLPRAASAAQEKYSDGRYSLYLDGERAMFEDSGKVLMGPCTSPVPLPSAPRQRY